MTEPAGADRRSFGIWIASVVALVVVVAVTLFVVARTDDGRTTPSDAASSDPQVDDDGAGRLLPSTPSDTVDASGRRVSPSLDADTPPTIDLTGDNFDRVWRQAQVLEGWLLRHPRPDLVSRIYLEGTPTHDEVRGVISELDANGRALVVENYRIGDISVVERPEADRVVLRYTDTYDFRDLVDRRTGEVIDHEVSNGQERAWTLTLQRGADAAWQVVSIAPADAGAAAQGP
jgi:hypothetical protein